MSHRLPPFLFFSRCTYLTYYSYFSYLSYIICWLMSPLNSQGFITLVHNISKPNTIISRYEYNILLLIKVRKLQKRVIYMTSHTQDINPCVKFVPATILPSSLVLGCDIDLKSLYILQLRKRTKADIINETVEALLYKRPLININIPQYINCAFLSVLIRFSFSLSYFLFESLAI